MSGKLSHQGVENRVLPIISDFLIFQTLTSVTCGRSEAVSCVWESARTRRGHTSAPVPTATSCSATRGHVRVGTDVTWWHRRHVEVDNSSDRQNGVILQEWWLVANVRVMKAVMSNVTADTMKPVLRDHCNDSPPLLEDHTFWADGRIFQCNWTSQKRSPVLRNYVLWPVEQYLKTGSSVRDNNSGDIWPNSNRINTI